MATKPIRHLAAQPAAVVLVCRKCSKKLGGGFGQDGDERLAKALRASLATPGAKPPKKLRAAPVAVLEVDCVKLCPKGAVVVMRGDRPGDWLLVPRDTPLTTITAELGLFRAS